MSLAPERLPAVFDTSPLIFLDTLGYVPQLVQLYQPYITPVVIQELQAKPGKPGSSILQLQIFTERTPTAATLHKVQAELTADPGEIASLALAVELDAWVVLDDKAARGYAQIRGLRLVGTLGVLLRLHRFALNQRSLEEDVARLERADMRLSERVKQQVLSTHQDSG